MKYFNEVLEELYENEDLVFSNEMIEYISQFETEDDLAPDVPYFYRLFRDELVDIIGACGDFRVPTLSPFQTFEEYTTLRIMEFIWYRGIPLN